MDNPVERELTERELETARILKKAWSRKKGLDRSLSQERLAEVMDLTQSGVSHYLNGRRAIGLELLFKFCRALDVDIIDVYPDTLIKGNAEETAQALEFLGLFLEADEGIKNGVLAILRNSSST